MNDHDDQNHDQDHEKKNTDAPAQLDESAAPSGDAPAPVTLFNDPFGLPHLEISEAQASDEELDLDADLRESFEVMSENVEAELSLDDTQLRQVEQAIAQEIQSQAEQALNDWKPDAGVNPEEQAKLLASQIAEDQALAAELAKADAMEEIDPELLAALPKAPVADEQGQLDLREVESCIEALLFMTDKPIAIAKVQELLGPDFSHAIFQEAVTSLKDRYQAGHHGFELVEVGGGLQFRTKPGRAALARKLAKVQTQRLSSGAMESLAIIAYRQPVMKEEIDKIRGVDSSYFVRGLMERKLIAISGRSELPGRPMLYSTTDEFLQLFGLKDLAALPSLREIEQMVPASQSKNPGDEDPRVREMRRLVGEMNADHSTSLVYNPEEDEKILQEIRERVQGIPTSTPFLDEQKEAAKAEALRLKEGGEAAMTQPPQMDLLSRAANSPHTAPEGVDRTESE